MKLSRVDRLIELFPEDVRLMHQATSGDARAFIKLYDVYVERVYRYVYCQVVNNRVAEGITFQVFFSVWKQLDGYKAVGLPFISWLYLIAQNQVNIYYRTHKSTVASDQDFLIPAERDSDREVRVIREALQFFTEEERQALILKHIVCMPIKNIARLTAMRESEIRASQIRTLQLLAGHLEEKEIKVNTQKIRRILTESQTKILNGTSTMEEQLARYPEHAAQLGPLLRTVLSLTLMRDVSPLFTFTAYTREALLHHISTHPHRLQKRVVSSRRISFAYAALILTLLFTGTARAQSALPGESFYPWKRASETVWRAISLDPIATDIMIAERRLNEWVLVANDPSRKVIAKNNYLEALTKLKSANETETLVLIVPVLQSQQQTLANAGLFASELNDYLSVAATLVPASVPPVASSTQSVPTATVINILVIPTQFIPVATAIPTEVAPTQTDVPTVVIPTQTDVPTVVIPTQTDIPTVVIPTQTDVPTEISPIPTDIPTRVVPIPTDIPPDTVPTPPSLPNENPPADLLP